MNDPISIVLLGDIAAGKGTQAKLIAKKFRLHLIDTGAYSRKILTRNSKVSARLSRIKLGKLAPSDIIQEYLKTEINRLKSSKGVLIDGGKMPVEAKLVNSFFFKQGRKFLVVYLHIPQSEIFKRLAYRYYCERTGQPVVIKDGSWKCPHCGGTVIKRADDDLLAVRNRIKYYDRVYSKTVKFWRQKGLLRKINGKQGVEKVTKDIIGAVRDFYGAS